MSPSSVVSFFSRVFRFLLVRRSLSPATIGVLPICGLLWCGNVAAKTSSTPDIEPIDGVGNNLAHPTWGSAGSDLLRIAPAGYPDGMDSPCLPQDLSAREVSNILNDQSDPSDPMQDLATVDRNSLSEFGFAFGQFMDHDMDLTPDGGASFPILVAPNDPIGPLPLEFSRSQTDPATGLTIGNPAQQVNVVTSYLDLSQVYGSSKTLADALRFLQHGLLKTSPGNMLPYDNGNYFTSDQTATANMANDAEAVSTGQLFVTGDRRGNENIQLTAMQTLFVRNHNRIASMLLAAHGNWTDEQIYQEARRLNIAGYQTVVYTEWIPAVLGPRALPAYTGYKAMVNASIANEFSTVAFRFGHSLLSSATGRENNQGQAMAPSIVLAEDFFDPNLLNPAGVLDPLTGLVSTDIGPILRGTADRNSEAMDLMAIRDVRDLLFGNGGLGGEDLVARDIQRDRDNGIPDYNSVRKAYGLPILTTFGQIAGTARPDIAQKLAQAYPGGISTIDAFEGGLAEAHLAGSEVGPTFQAVMVDQFRRLRDGDRFFYLNQTFNAEENKIIQQGNTLGKIIAANSSASGLQASVMVFHASISGVVSTKKVKKAGGNSAPVVTVYLENATEDILATTQTDQKGSYSFNELSGPAQNAGIASGVSGTGSYQIVIVPPAGFSVLTASSGSIQISRGDSNVTGVDFTLVPLP